MKRKIISQKIKRGTAPARVSVLHDLWVGLTADSLGEALIQMSPRGAAKKINKMGPTTIAHLLNPIVASDYNKARDILLALLMLGQIGNSMESIWTDVADVATVGNLKKDMGISLIELFMGSPETGHPPRLKDRYRAVKSMALLNIQIASRLLLKMSLADRELILNRMHESLRLKLVAQLKLDIDWRNLYIDTYGDGEW